MKITYVALLLPLAMTPLCAQQTLTGEVIDEALNPIRGVTIRVPSLGTGAVSNAAGRFTLSRIPEPLDRLELRLSAVGYHDTTVVVGLPATPPPRIMLQMKVAHIDPVVVTGNRTATYVKNLPVKVEVISSEDLHKVRAVDFSAACEYSPGIKVQNNCGVCGTNEIRTQGLPGQYSQVLINGHPIISNLGMVYGLMGISTASIRQVEIVKGPGQVLFGPEAVGGTINIITKQPEEMPALTVEVGAASNQEHSATITGAKSWDALATSVTADYAGSYHRRDRNGDGFTDAPLFQRLTLMNQWSGTVAGSWEFDITGRLYHEERFGGQMHWNRETDRGGDQVYGEWIGTFREEVFGGVERRFSDDVTVTAHISQTYHNQDSYYGTTAYRADQIISYTDVMAMYRLGDRSRITFGGAYLFERYDDNTPATVDYDDPMKSAASYYHTVSVFAESELGIGEWGSAMFGLRYNHHNLQGTIWQPRGNLKVDLAPGSTLRLSAGTGFRSVNIFTEDHAALSGFRRLVIEEELNPERSISGSAGFIQDFDLGDQFARFTVDGFHTRFSNQIIADYDSDPDAVIYRNLAGHSIAQGVETGFEYQFAFPFRVKFSHEWLETYQTENGRRAEIKFNPRHRLFWDLDYDWEETGLDINLVGKWVGRQALPEFPEPFARPVWSAPYAVWNLQITRTFGRMDVFAGVSNMFDYRQESPLIDPGNPFSEYFDTSYVYGPLEGRVLFVGMRGAFD